MQLAAEALIKDWITISEPALEKFMNDNFSLIENKVNIDTNNFKTLQI